MKHVFSRIYWQDKDIEIVIGRLLRYGVLLSGIVTLVGGSIYLLRHGNTLPRYHTFTGEPKDVSSLSGVFQGIAGLQGRAIIQLGILLLIATPIARIVFSVIAFVLEKDYLYVVITLIVLIVIGFSIRGGLGG